MLFLAERVILRLVYVCLLAIEDKTAAMAARSSHEISRACSSNSTSTLAVTHTTASDSQDESIAFET